LRESRKKRGLTEVFLSDIQGALLLVQALPVMAPSPLSRESQALPFHVVQGRFARPAVSPALLLQPLFAGSKQQALGLLVWSGGLLGGLQMLDELHPYCRFSI